MQLSRHAILADVPGRGVPVVSVGASNPSGAAVSLFSNTGPWVSCYRPGVAVVSTNTASAFPERTLTTPVLPRGRLDCLILPCRPDRAAVDALIIP